MKKSEKKLTRRNCLKAGVLGLAVLTGGKLVSDYCSRPSTLVEKVKFLGGFEGFQKIDSYPIALAGQDANGVSFLLGERDERPILGHFFPKPDQLGIYVADGSVMKRVRTLPVSFSNACAPQGYSAIGKGPDRYDCFNSTGFDVGVVRTKLESGLSNLLYSDKGSDTRIRAASGNLILLENNAGEEFVFADSRNGTASYSTSQKLRFPKGDEWKDIEGYMRNNSPKPFERVVNNYLKRAEVRLQLGAELEDAGYRGPNNPGFNFSPSGIAGDCKATFGFVLDGKKYFIVRKTIGGVKK